MMDQYLEQEIKFFVNNLGEIESQIIDQGAILIQPRIKEHNLVFDNQSGDFTKNRQVLRLRKDTHNKLTFKGTGKIVDGILLRKEIEIEVSDFDKSKSILEALGYQISLCYEKFRSAYKFDEIYITFDEMPFGNFIEVEGQDPTSIMQLSLKLGLNWEHRILCSYQDLFLKVKNNLRQEIENLTFLDFEFISVRPEMLGVIPADS